MTASFAAGKVNELSGPIAESNLTGQADIDLMLGNIVTNALAGGICAAVGGNAGAFAGATVDRLNRQLHPHESKSGWICNAAKARARSTDMHRS